MHFVKHKKYRKHSRNYLQHNDISYNVCLIAAQQKISSQDFFFHQFCKRVQLELLTLQAYKNIRLLYCITKINVKTLIVLKKVYCSVWPWIHLSTGYEQGAQDEAKTGIKFTIGKTAEN